MMRVIVTCLLVVLLFLGCSGLKPYEPRNNREEGPPQGLITGPAGEFVIKPEMKK